MPVREHKCRATSKSAEAKNIESGTANESYDTNITELDSALVNKPSLWVAKDKSKDSAKSSFGCDVIDVGIVIVPDGKPHCFVAITIICHQAPHTKGTPWHTRGLSSLYCSKPSHLILLHRRFQIFHATVSYNSFLLRNISLGSGSFLCGLLCGSSIVCGLLYGCLLCSSSFVCGLFCRSGIVCGLLCSSGIVCGLLCSSGIVCRLLCSSGIVCGLLSCGIVCKFLGCSDCCGRRFEIGLILRGKFGVPELNTVSTTSK